MDCPNIDADLYRAHNKRKTDRYFLAINKIRQRLLNKVDDKRLLNLS